ncbi:MAG: DMT family transporter [Thermoleophilaceae bacterium]|nr:DMT family transporter [Thermoleophilaceae bacterium]
MDKGIAIALTAFVGGLVAIQGPINGRLGQSIGSFPAAAVSFITGTIILVTLALMFGGGFGKIASQSPPWHYFLGGLLGAAYVTTVLITVKTLGASGIAAATVTGQLTTAVVIDRAGAFGLHKTPITPARILGIALLAAGTYLITTTTHAPN